MAKCFLLRKRLNNLDKRLEQMLSKYGDSKRDKIESLFKKRNPQYEILKKETSDLWKRKYNHEKLIDNREKIVNRIISFKSLIDNYTNNQIIG